MKIIKCYTMHLRISRHLLSGNWSDTVSTMKHRVKDIHNDIVTINYSKIVTSDTDLSFYNTKISQPQPILSTIQITTVPTNTTTTTTQVSLARNMISAFTINAGNLLNQSHHNIMVAILLGIFMCITLTITIAIFVFCRKKNSVFMLQKCEQDSDLEMTDMNTEADTSDSEYEFIESSSVTPGSNTRRSLTSPELNSYASQDNIAEETHTDHDRHSKNRSGNHRNRHRLSASPTSTPLLTSNSDIVSKTGSSSRKIETNSQNTITQHSLSLDYVSEINGAKFKTSVKSTRKKCGDEIVEKNKTPRGKASGKRKEKISIHRENDKTCENNFPIQQKRANSKQNKDASKTKQEPWKLDLEQSTSKTKESKSPSDSSILHMVSVDDDSDWTEQSGLLDDISDPDLDNTDGIRDIM